MHPRRPWNAALATALALLLPALAPAVGAATDAVTNGTFASDTQGWTFTVAAGAPTGSWDAAGQANGGAAKTSSETGSQKTGTARWDQGLASIGAGATVTLSYAWKKGYEAKKPLKQDLAVRLLKPGGAVVVLDAQNGAPSAYDAWFTVNDKDVSAHFTETGVYTLQLQYAYKTGKHAQAKALAWFDEVRLLVGAPSGTWVERAPSPEPGAFGEALAGTGSYLYLVRDTSATATPQLRRYDPAADGWTSLGTSGLPDGAFRNGATLTWDEAGHLYALGGARYSDADRRAFFRYDIDADSWTQLADTPAPQGAGDAAAWSGTAGLLYALLGSSQHGAAFASYAPGNGTWSTLAAPPAGIDDGASLAWAGGGHLFALRGEYFETSPPVQDFWRYDVANDTWSSLADIPETDGVGDGGSLLWTGGFDPSKADVLYALGGNSPSEQPGYDAYLYDIASDAWEALPDLPYPVGNYNGNRLGYAGGHLHYWQGSPSGFDGGGNRTARLEA